MTGNGQDPAAETSDKIAGDRGVGCDADPSLCLTETFTDREVVLTRCLEQKNCRYKQLYMRMSICSCPDVRPN